ncbi:MAG: hypothetical protein AAF411_15695 [Myxococcota bacterium]
MNGSEGEMGVVAYDFADLCWLLAGGVGPMEAVEGSATKPSPEAHLQRFASAHFPEAQKTPNAVLWRARDAFPTFETDFLARRGSE